MTGGNALAWGKLLLAIIGAVIGGLLITELLTTLKKYGVTVQDAANAVNPLNPENIFVMGANAATKEVTGDPSLGGWIHDKLHSDPTIPPVYAEDNNGGWLSTW